MSQKSLLSERTILRATHVSFPTSPAVSHHAKDFIRRCLTPSQTDRPFIKDLCDHPFVLNPS